MRRMFRGLTCLLALTGLAACVALGPVGSKAKGPNPVTGGDIEVTALDEPGAKTTETGKDKAAGKEAPSGNKDKTAGKAGEAGKDKTATVTSGETEAAPAVPPGTKPKARPEGIADTAKAEAAAEVAAPVPAEAEPGKAKSEAQIACEKRGDIWAKAGSSAAHACVKRTKDGGKRCTDSTQCQGQCLARSGTCSPYAPLFGCNEILDDNGRQMTLCLD